MRALSIAFVLASTPAFAQWELIGLGFSSLEVSCKGTTALNASSSKASRVAECERNADCHVSYECHKGQCITGEEQYVPVERKVKPATACPTGMICEAVKPSLRRRAAELYLRTRVVELREELALGRGPLIKGLALAEGVAPEKLGRALREHRAEMVTLIGDASDSEWSARFLTRVEELCGRT